MKRNGNDRVETAFAESLIVERGDQPARDQMTKMDLAAVFKIENDVANNAAAAVGRDGGIEMERAMRAVGAGKRGCDCTVKRLGTFRAKRWHFEKPSLRSRHKDIRLNPPARSRSCRTADRAATRFRGKG